MCCKLQRVSYIVSKRLELWSTNGFKLEVSFHPPSVNSAFHLIARLRGRRSANGTQQNFAKQLRVGPANNIPQRSWGRPCLKMGAKKTFTFVRFSTTSTPNGEYLLKETWRRQSARALENTKGILRFAKFHKHWSVDSLKPARSFYPPSLFCFVPVHRTLSMRH